jgi:hypothetical protein
MSGLTDVAERSIEGEMDCRRFYKQLFAPLAASLGTMDAQTIVAIVGFEAGGPLNFCTIGQGSGRPCVTYVSCELAVRDEQRPTDVGRYELLVSCDDELWVRSVVTRIGRMSFETVFGNGHTLDIGPWVCRDDPLQGVVFEQVCNCRIDVQDYGIFRIIGVSRAEMKYSREHGTPALLAKLKAAGVYPDTQVKRNSVI